MSYEQIRYDVAAGIATITLNRPDRLNAVTTRLLDERRPRRRRQNVRPRRPLDRG